LCAQRARMYMPVCLGRANYQHITGIMMDIPTVTLCRGSRSSAPGKDRFKGNGDGTASVPSGLMKFGRLRKPLTRIYCACGGPRIAVRRAPRRTAVPQSMRPAGPSADLRSPFRSLTAAHGFHMRIPPDKLHDAVHGPLGLFLIGAIPTRPDPLLQSFRKRARVPHDQYRL
jgi:hypothetical protein